MARSYDPSVDKVVRRIETGMSSEPHNPTAGISERNFLGGYIRNNRSEVNSYIDNLAKSDASLENRKRVQNLRAKVDFWGSKKPIYYNDGGPSFRSMRLSRDNSYSLTLPSSNTVLRFLATGVAVAGVATLLYLGWQLREAILAINDSPTIQMRQVYTNE